MKILIPIVMCILFTGCASPSLQTDRLLNAKKLSLAKKSLVKDVPFYQQKKNHCGPAVLGMALSHKNKVVDVDILASQMFTPLKEGTFQTDLISATRRQGMLAVPVKNMASLLTEIEHGNPVIVFQNLALKSAPKWHYALATGYNLKGPDVIVHSGDKKNEKMDMRIFEHYWKGGDYWGIVVIKPGELSATGDDLMHVNEAAAFEQLSMIDEAEASYHAILNKWPDSLAAHIGLGNIKYTHGLFSEAVIYLRAATIKHPESAVAWHNLALAQAAAMLLPEARESSKKAIQLADVDLRPAFSKNLKDLL